MPHSNTDYKFFGLVFFISVSSTFVLANITNVSANEKIAWGADTQGLKASISTRKNSYTFGEPIQIYYRLKNDSNNNVRLFRTDALDEFDFEIVGIDLGVVSFADPDKLSKRRPIPLTLYGKKKKLLSSEASASLFILFPTKQYESSTIRRYFLNQLYDMSIAGEYEIKLSRKVTFKGDENFFTVESNVLRIKVVNPDERSIEPIEKPVTKPKK